jgi:hypothetical protein
VDSDGSNGRRKTESAMAAVPGAALGVVWRHRGLAWSGQPGRMAGRWAAAARGCQRDSGGGAGQHAEVGRCGDGGGSAALGEVPGTALSFEHG